MNATGTESVLHTFSGAPDGERSFAGVTLDPAGNLYGTTAGGGAGVGIVYKIDTAGAETVLYSFTGKPDGALPEAGLIRDAAGNLYGTTVTGGTGGCSNGCGTVFKLDPAGHESLVSSFGGGDGFQPHGGVVADGAGNLYGTTQLSGGSGHGGVYRVDPSGHVTVLYSFKGKSDGGSPVGDLALDAAGNLYGTTLLGGIKNSKCPDGCGVVFKIGL